MHFDPDGMQQAPAALRQVEVRVTSTTNGWAYLKSYPVADRKTAFLMPTYRVTVSGTNNGGEKVNTNFTAIRFGVYRPTSESAPSVVGLASAQTHTVKEFNPNYTLSSTTVADNGAWRVTGSYLIHDGPDFPTSSMFGSKGCIEICKPGEWKKFNDTILSLSGTTEKDRTKALTEVGKSGAVTVKYEEATPPPLKPVERKEPEKK